MKRTQENLVQDYPFLKYTTTNLFIYAEKAADSRSDALHDEKEILQKVLNFWVHIYQKLNKYSSVWLLRGTTLLYIAAAANLVDLIAPAILDIKDITIRNSHGDTALHLAARRGHIIAGKILRRKGADQDAKNHSSKTLLFEAASGGHIEFVEWLLDEGVNLESKGDGGAL